MVIFDEVEVLDAVLRDPDRPAQLLPSYDSGDHLHVNNAGNIAQGNAISLALFHRRLADGRPADLGACGRRRKVTAAREID